jgi:MinD superfamily P-loop ATPase
VAVVNRSDLGSDGVRSFLSREGVPVLAEIPFDRDIATACAAGALARDEIPAFAATMDGMASHLLTWCGVHP